MLADELFTKASQRLENCLSVSNNSVRKFFSSLESPMTFVERFKVT